MSPRRSLHNGSCLREEAKRKQLLEKYEKECGNPQGGRFRKRQKREPAKSFTDWMYEKAYIGRNEGWNMHRVTDFPVTPMEDEEGTPGHSSISAIGFFPPPLTRCGLTPEDRDDYTNWLMWSTHIKVQEELVDIVDTMLQCITLILVRGHINVRTERFSPMLKYVSDRWRPIWTPKMDNDGTREDEATKAMWMVDNYSYVIKAGGFETPNLLKNYLRMRSRRTVYDNLKLLAHICSQLPMEMSPLLETTVNALLIEIDAITLTKNFNASVPRPRLESEPHIYRSDDPVEWFKQMFRFTWEEPNGDDCITQMARPKDLDANLWEEATAQKAEPLE